MIRVVFANFIMVLVIAALGAACSDPPQEMGAASTQPVPDAGGVCMPGEMGCVDGFEATCGANALWVISRNVGECGGREESCAEARQSRSYIGCEYWPVDLDNAIEVWPEPPSGPQCDIPTDDPWQYRVDVPVCTDGQLHRGLCDPRGVCPDGTTCQTVPSCVLDAQSSDYAVVVSNPSNRTVASVTLEGLIGARMTVDVPPGGVSKLYPYRNGLADQSLNGTMRGSAFRLTSTSPIVAYQFNPLDNQGVFSNDGSLLLPSHALDALYFVLTLPTLNRRPSAHAYGGYVVIVATAAGTTDVEVIASTTIQAGESEMELAAAEPHRFQLDQGQALSLTAAGRGDLTGTRIASPDGRTPFAVFVGHESTMIVERDRFGQPGVCCADHVEEQLFPLTAWGQRFAVARTEPRADETRGGTSAPDAVRILARTRDTDVQISPPPIEGQCGRLVAGDYCDVFIDSDTEITANHPVLVGHMLLSTDGEMGDPALAFVAPVEQFRESYTFLVPDEYAQQYASIVGRAGDRIILDQTDIRDSFRPFGAEFAAARIALQPGRHVLECPQGCGLLVHGYDEAVSYMFAGGLDLEPVRAD